MKRKANYIWARVYQIDLYSSDIYEKFRILTGLENLKCQKTWEFEKQSFVPLKIWFWVGILTRFASKLVANPDTQNHCSKIVGEQQQQTNLLTNSVIIPTLATAAYEIAVNSSNFHCGDSIYRYAMSSAVDVIAYNTLKSNKTQSSFWTLLGSSQKKITI